MVLYSYTPIAVDKEPYAANLKEYLMQSSPKNAAARATALSLLEELATKGEFSLDLPIQVAEHGKPCFVGEAAPDFNLSHSGELAAAVLGSCRVGIDVQEEKESLDTEKMAARFFGDKEKEALKGAPRTRFFELWTKKEALGKHFGTGLSPLLGKDTDDIAASHSLSFLTERILVNGRAYTLTVCAAEPIQKA